MLYVIMLKCYKKIACVVLHSQSLIIKRVYSFFCKLIITVKSLKRCHYDKITIKLSLFDALKTDK